MPRPHARARSSCSTTITTWPAPAIPLRDLLNHTSGLYNHSDDPRLLEGFPLKQWRPEELLQISLEHPRTTGFPGIVHSGAVTVQNTSWAGAAGAVVPSARDLATFYGSLDRLLPRKQYAAMHTGTYGLGLFPIQTRCGTAWGHNGAVPGYYTDAFTLGARTAVEMNTRRQTDGRKVARALCRR